jgi:hypothetical protein
MWQHLKLFALVIGLWITVAAGVVVWHAVVTHAPVLAFAVLIVVFVGACWRGAVLTARERAPRQPGPPAGRAE